MKAYLSTCLLTSAAFVAFSPGVASANEAAADAGSSEASAPEIIVTAQKRTERLLDVPLAVSAVDANTLAERNQTKLQDYFATVPGLNLFSAGNGQTVLAVRGLSTGTAANPVVGITIDDVPYGSSTALAYGSRLVPDIDPGSLARVEVLRGPQGTLYGASSIGGLLKFVTQDPSTTATSGRVQIDGSAVDGGEIGFGVRGVINVPLSSTLALRASGFGRRDAGYVDNLTTNQHDVNRVGVYGGHAVLLWRPAPGLSAKFSALYQKSKSDGSADVDTNASLEPTSGDLNQRRLPNSGKYALEAQLYSAVLTAELAPKVSITSVTGYGITRYDGNIDIATSFDFGPGGSNIASVFFPNTVTTLLNRHKTKKFSQEIRLNASAGIFDLLVGGFYTNERSPIFQAIGANDVTTGALVGTISDASFPSTFKEYAGFGDLTVHLTDRFDVQLGGRYSQNKQTYFETDTGPLNGPDPIIITANSKDHVFTYLVTPRYRFSDDLMVYARVASGYRAGGPNPGATTGFPVQYGPDRTTNYELGTKGKILDGLTFDASLYYINWKNVQVTLRDAASGFLFTKNGGNAKSQGAELTLQYQSHDGLVVVANGSLSNAKLTSDPPTGAGTAKDGDRLPLSARFSGSFSIDKDFEISNGSTLFVGGTLSYVGQREGNFVANPLTPRLSYGAYASVDLRAGLRRDGWSYTAYVANVGDRRGIVGADTRRLTGVSTATSGYYANYIRPRTFGLTVAKTF